MDGRMYVTKRRVYDKRRLWFCRLFHSIPKGEEVKAFAEIWSCRMGHCYAVIWKGKMYHVDSENLESLKVGEGE